MLWFKSSIQILKRRPIGFECARNHTESIQVKAFREIVKTAIIQSDSVQTKAKATTDSPDI